MTDIQRLDDRQLLQLFVVKKDSDAFRELFARHYRQVWSACRRRLFSREDLVEDAVQAVFLALFRYAGQIRSGSVLSAWLYRTAGFASAQILRADMRRRERERKAANMKEEMLRDPVPEAGWAEVRSRLDAAVDRLPGKQRDAVVMHFFSGKSLTEISGETGIGRETLRKRVDAGLEKLRLMLSTENVAVSASGLGAMVAAHAAEAAPAGLQQTIFTAVSSNLSAGGSAAGSLVNIAVKGIGKIMFMAKLKVAAGVAFVAAVAAGLGSAILVAQSGPAKDDKPMIIAPMPADAFSFIMVKNETVVLKNMLEGWGPSWKPYLHFGNPDATIEDGVLASSSQVKFGDNSFTCKERVSKGSDGAVTWQYDLSSDKDVDLTMFSNSISVPSGVAGQLEITTGNGEKKTMEFKMGKGSLDKVAKAVYKFTDYGDLTLTFDPPTDVAFDNSVRVKLAGSKMPAGAHTVKITASVGSPVQLAITPEERAKLTVKPADADWYPQQMGIKDLGPSVIGMENWLAKPAGAKGQVKIVGDHFEFEDGTKVRFWGTNLCYGGVNPPKEAADFTAARFAKYGINCVRFHKFLERGVGDKDDWTKLDPAGADRMDYFASVLAKNGVYFTFSPFFGFRVGPGNKDKVLAYNEIIKLDKERGAYGLVNYAEDVQDLVAAMYTTLLTHKNPHSGKTYAEDPALAAVEIQNEDDIFWGSLKKVYPACPIYAKALKGRFAEWLKEKYSSQDKLKEAWGDALKSGETLENGNIEIQYDPWFSGLDNLPKLTGGASQRMLDNAAFLHHTQNKYYAKLVKAIRATGYKGPIIGSPWQATTMVPHYYNLKSDAIVGLVDRHNYFGGLTNSMLARPGLGYFGTGFQQVMNNPFSVSEWIHSWPALYAAEGPAIMAVYGMGLQGWDASWEFQSSMRNDASDANKLLSMRTMTGGKDRNDVWCVDTPANVGQYPALARMVYRGDVKPGDIISIRQVSDENLATGKFDFEDKVVQVGDRKAFSSTVPSTALAAGRVVVEFTGEKEAKSTMPDMAKFDKDGVITSNTGQLAWDYSADKGFFTVNTAGTKAAVGFHTGKPLVCDNVTITPAAQFASIFLTALEPDKTLANCKGALITAVAQQCNTGFSYMIDMTVVNKGTAPTVLEPVKATFKITGRKIEAVNVLSQEGTRVEGQTVKVEGDSFTIDTGRDKTFYYEVVFAE